MKGFKGMVFFCLLNIRGCGRFKSYLGGFGIDVLKVYVLLCFLVGCCFQRKDVFYVEVFGCRIGLEFCEGREVGVQNGEIVKNSCVSIVFRVKLIRI